MNLRFLLGTLKQPIAANVEDGLKHVFFYT